MEDDMQTRTVTVQDVQDHLPELLTQVKRGEKFIIEKDNIPMAELTGLASPPQKRTAGLNRGDIQMADDFDSPLPDTFWLGEK